MTVSGALTRGRAAAESLMSDTATITRAGEGQGPFNPDTGTYDPPPPTTVYEGKCKVQLTDSLDVSVAEFGGQAVNLTRVEVHIPVTDVDIHPEDTVTVTAAAYDPQLVGQVYTVKDTHMKSQATARRLECERKAV